MWRDKATGAKKCPNRYISQHFFCGLFSCKAGTFRNPLEMRRFILPIEFGVSFAS